MGIVSKETIAPLLFYGYKKTYPTYLSDSDIATLAESYDTLSENGRFVVETHYHQQHIKEAYEETELAPIITIIVMLAKQSHEILLSGYDKRIHECVGCGKSIKYGTYQRGPRKGQENRNKQTYPEGIMLTFLTSTFGSHTKQICTNCWNSITPILTQELKDTKVKLPEQLQHPTSIKWDVHHYVFCNICDPNHMFPPKIHPHSATPSNFNPTSCGHEYTEQEYIPFLISDVEKALTK